MVQQILNFIELNPMASFVMGVFGIVALGMVLKSIENIVSLIMDKTQINANVKTNVNVGTDKE